MKQGILHPGDISVALQLAVAPESKLTEIAGATARSLGEVHNATERLRKARLIAPERRRIVIDPFLLFLRWGVPYAFPPIIGGMAIGIETATLTERVGPEDRHSRAIDQQPIHHRESEYVWPSAEGEIRGQALVPLYPAAPTVARLNPGLWMLLSLVDLIRVGGTREGSVAIDAISALCSRREG